MGDGAKEITKAGKEVCILISMLSCYPIYFVGIWRCWSLLNLLAPCLSEPYYSVIWIEKTE